MDVLLLPDRLLVGGYASLVLIWGMRRKIALAKKEGSSLMATDDSDALDPQGDQHPENADAGYQVVFKLDGMTVRIERGLHKTSDVLDAHVDVATGKVTVSQISYQIDPLE